MKYLVSIAGYCAFAACCVLLLDYIFVTADVHVSHSTGNCVGVTTYQGVFFDTGDYNCENLPEKYNHIWVK